MALRSSRNIQMLVVVGAMALTSTVEARAVSMNGRELQQAPQLPVFGPPPPVPLDAESIPYDWGLDFTTTQRADSERYQRQITDLLDSPLSDWQILPRENYTWALRPMQLNGATFVVDRFSTQYKTKGGRAFFEFLTTPDGFALIDPDTEDHKITRELSKPFEAPEGAIAYPVAQITRFPEGFAPTGFEVAIAVTASHWQLCGDNEMTFYSYTVPIPFEDRIPEVQALADAPEWTNVFGLRVKQLYEDTIEVTEINWFDLAPPDNVVASSTVYEAFHVGLDVRVRAHLAVTDYPAATGDECSADMSGGYGGGGGMYGAY